MVKKKNYTNEEIKELVLEYLENRYGEKFVGISYSSPGLMNSGYEFTVYPKNKTKEDSFVVYGNYHKDTGEFSFSDGHYGVLMQPEFQKLYEDIVSDYYDEFLITVRTIGGANYSKKYTMDELLKMNEINDINSEIYIDVKDSSTVKTNVVDVLQGIAQKMKDMKLTGTIWIKIVKDEKYSYLKENIGEIDVEDREYFVYPVSKQYPQYTAVVFENIETGELVIHNDGEEN